MVTYAADGTPVTLQVKTSDANVEIIPMNAIDPNTSILCYTVPKVLFGSDVVEGKTKQSKQTASQTEQQ